MRSPTSTPSWQAYVRPQFCSLRPAAAAAPAHRHHMYQHQYLLRRASECSQITDGGELSRLHAEDLILMS